MARQNDLRIRRAAAHRSIAQRSGRGRFCWLLMSAAASTALLDECTFECIKRSGRQYLLLELETFFGMGLIPCQRRCTGTPVITVTAQSVTLKFGQGNFARSAPQKGSQLLEITLAEVAAASQRLCVDEAGLAQLLHSGHQLAPTAA